MTDDQLIDELRKRLSEKTGMANYEKTWGLLFHKLKDAGETKALDIMKSTANECGVAYVPRRRFILPPKSDKSR